VSEQQDTSTITRPGSKLPLWFPKVRLGDAAHFKTWGSYLDKRKPGDQAATIYNVAKESTTRPGSENLASGSWERLSIEVPWMTFVLGSGCLMTPDTASLDGAREALQTRLATDLDDFAQRYPELPLVESVTNFVERLAKDRADYKDPPGEVASTERSGLEYVNLGADAGPTRYTSRVALAATLATRLYAAALASGVHVVGSAAREEVQLPPASSWWGASASNELLRPLLSVLSTLKETGDGAPKSRQALGALASKMLDELPTPDDRNPNQSAMILRRHVELLTAFAWYFLTDGARVYPGWSDLLLFQSFEDTEWFANEADSPNPRPRLKDVISQDGWVYDRIVHVTNTSWQSRTDDEAPTTRGSFYDLIADFLIQQARVIKTRVMPSGYAGPPLPVGFVSSFDLELEMALWRKNEPFIVVMPVLATSDKLPSSASLHWVWARVVPSAEEALAGPRPSQSGRWRDAAHSKLELPHSLVHPARWERLISDTPEGRWKGLPVVVRLTGSPLMDPPAAETLKPTTQSDAIHHALLLDEYTAMQQVALDFGSQPGGALPTWITHNKATSAPRFWMLMGTQLADTGIRLRLMAQLMAARRASFADRRPDDVATEDPAASSESRPETGDASAGDPDASSEFQPMLGSQKLLGLLLNDKSGTNDRELFLWNGLDVVDGTHVKCMPALGALLTRLEDDFSKIEAAKPRGAAIAGGSKS
jgi:hypothetical protein